MTIHRWRFSYVFICACHNSLCVYKSGNTRSTIGNSFCAMMISHTIKFFLSFFIFISITSLSFALSSSEYSLSSHDNLDKFSSSDEQVLELFQLWKKEHGKQYENSEENAKRFETFRSNLKHINEINAKRKSPTRHRLSLNKFADISPEEFSKTYLQETPSKYGDRKLKDEDDDDCDNLPASVDWRKEGAVTEVKDQGNCRKNVLLNFLFLYYNVDASVLVSCFLCTFANIIILYNNRSYYFLESHWAFAVVGTIEGFNKIVTGNLIELSAQELVDCDPASHGCAGGFYFNAFGWVINNGGIDTEANYPYTAKNGTCKVLLLFAFVLSFSNMLASATIKLYV